MKLGGKLMEALRKSNNRKLETLWKQQMEAKKNKQQK
jgi:hypothetical protein